MGISRSHKRGTAHRTLHRHTFLDFCINLASINILQVLDAVIGFPENKTHLLVSSVHLILKQQQL